MLRLATLSFLLCTAVACDSGSSTDSDADSDTSTGTDTGTDTGTGTETETGTGTGTETETGPPDKCDDRPRFQCQGGAETCARVCGTIGPHFMDYYVDQRALLSQLKCDQDGDVKLSLMLDDTDARVFFNLMEGEVGKDFEFGGSSGNSVVDFSQDGSSLDAWSSQGWKKVNDERVWSYGAGTGRLYKYDSLEDGGQVLGKITVTKAYNVDGQSLLADDPQTGSMLIEFQGVCKKEQ